MAKKILVIDDDPIIVKYLETLFQDNGYATCAATNGIEAYDVFAAEKPDLITLDLQMPEEWGPRFYRRLVKNRENRSVPIVVVSGLAGDHAIRNAVAFVKKPFDADKLLEIVRGAIGPGESG